MGTAYPSSSPRESRSDGETGGTLSEEGWCRMSGVWTSRFESLGQRRNPSWVGTGVTRTGSEGWVLCHGGSRVPLSRTLEARSLTGPTGGGECTVPKGGSVRRHEGRGASGSNCRNDPRTGRTGREDGRGRIPCGPSGDWTIHFTTELYGPPTENYRWACPGHHGNPRPLQCVC